MGGSISNDNLKQSELHVMEKTMNSSYDKLIEFYANIIIHQNP